MNNAGNALLTREFTLFSFEGAVNDPAPWSSGQDGGLSRRKQEFDSPTGHQRTSEVLLHN